MSHLSCTFFFDLPSVQTVKMNFIVASQLRSLKIPMVWPFLYHCYRLGGKKILKRILPTEKPCTLMVKLAWTVSVTKLSVTFWKILNTHNSSGRIFHFSQLHEKVPSSSTVFQFKIFQEQTNDGKCFWRKFVRHVFKT